MFILPNKQWTIHFVIGDATINLPYIRLTSANDSPQQRIKLSNWMCLLCFAPWTNPLTPACWHTLGFSILFSKEDFYSLFLWCFIGSNTNSRDYVHKKIHACLAEPNDNLDVKQGKQKKIYYLTRYYDICCFTNPLKRTIPTSHNASFCLKMCACVHLSVSKWCIMRYLSCIVRFVRSVCYTAVLWTSLHLNSPATRLFVQRFIRLITTSDFRTLVETKRCWSVDDSVIRRQQIRNVSPCRDIKMENGVPWN